MTALEFWKLFSPAAITIGGAFFAYVIWTKMKIHGLEGSMEAMKEAIKKHEDKEKEQDASIKSLQGKEADDKLRGYRMDEIERRLCELSEQLVAGFAEIRGAINAGNVQTALILERQGNMQASLEKVEKRVDRQERIIASSGIAGEGVDEP